MTSRRSFARTLAYLGTVPAWTEASLAQRALAGSNWPPNTVWLNANENPDGPCQAAVAAMNRAIPESWRYHFPEFRDFQAAIAKSEQAQPDQVVLGSGSTEVLNAIVMAHTSSTRPLITPHPTFEAPVEYASALGRNVIRVPLTEKHAADVKRLAEEAERAGGGLIYLCNPNNPTSLLTPKAELDWLVSNLPRETVLLVDEAYLHFVDGFEEQTAMRHVRDGKNVVVARTFSKIYGMAGLRIGFACGAPGLMRGVQRFRNNPFSIVGMRAAMAALAEAPTLVPQRRAKLTRIRDAFCGWLRQRNLRYIEPSANFVMIDTGRDVRELGAALLRKEVAAGRPFPPLDNLLRVSIGTEQDMAKFRQAFLEVYPG